MAILREIELLQDSVSIAVSDICRDLDLA